MKKSKCWLGLLAVLMLPPAQAANREIRALFQPDPSLPHKNEFVNKTPNSGYCANYPSECASNNMFSIQVPVRFNSARAMNRGEILQLKVPANWRRLTVTNRETLETEIVEVRIIGIGSDYVLSDSAANLTGETDIRTGHQKLWEGSSWVNAPAPCQYSGVGAFSPNTYRFFWKAPQEAHCTKRTLFNIPAISFDTMDFSYELRTPFPMSMSTGLYTGSLTYTLGPGKDFSLGSLMYPDDSTLTLDFVLDVQHTLKVDLPPGGEKIVLEPAGGWQQWIDGGQKPTSIYRDQTFHITASSRFKVMMQCSSLGGERCQMFGGGESADVMTKITLPAGITFSGQPVGYLLLRHNVWSGPFEPSRYVERQVGTLHFAMPKDSIDRLLRTGVGASLSGNITIIWDSEV